MNLKFNHTIIILATAALLFGGASALQASPESRAGDLIKRNAETICGFAHPTAKYRSGTYWTSTQRDGTVLVTLELEYWDNFWGRVGTTDVNFHFDRFGNFETIGRAENNAFMVTGLFIGTMVGLIESGPEFQEEYRNNAATRVLWNQLKENANARGLLTFGLKIDQGV